MEEKDKIYDLFKRNEHKLEQKPSHRAWDRLESRLEKFEAEEVSSPPAIQPWYRYGGMVAAVLIMVVTASTLYINTNMNSSDKAQFASADSNIALSPLQDLPNLGSKNNFLKIVQYQKEYKDNFEQKISEGEVGWELIPRKTFAVKKRAIAGNKPEKNNNKKSTASKKTFAEVEIAKEIPELEETAVLSDFGTKFNHFSPEPQNNGKKVIAETSVQTTSAKTDAKELLKDRDDERVEEEYAEKIKEDKVMADAIVSAPTVTAPIRTHQSTSTVVPSPAPASAQDVSGNVGNGDYKTMDDAEIKEEITAIADEAEGYVSYDMNTETLESVVVETEKNENALDIFEWLIGSWEENTANGISMEKWEKVDDTTIKGEGQLVANGVTIFKEKMEIRKTNKGIFLFISLEKNNKKTKYKLISQTGRELIFENNKVDFPQQLVMYKNSKNDFTTIMQNSNISNTGGASPDNYLQNRNQIMNQKVSRKMKRKM